jgi:hypothetical protein
LGTCLRSESKRRGGQAVGPEHFIAIATLSAPLGVKTAAVAFAFYLPAIATREDRGLFWSWGTARMVTDRRYEYGDTGSRLDFAGWVVCEFDRFTGHRKGPSRSWSASRFRSADVGGSGPKMRSSIDSRVTTKRSQTRSCTRHQRWRTASSVPFSTCPTISGPLACSPSLDDARCREHSASVGDSWMPSPYPGTRQQKRQE